MRNGLKIHCFIMYHLIFSAFLNIFSIDMEIGASSLVPFKWRGLNSIIQPDETASQLFGRVKNSHLHTGVAALDSVFGTIDPGQMLEVAKRVCLRPRHTC